MKTSHIIPWGPTNEKLIRKIITLEEFIKFIYQRACYREYYATVFRFYKDTTTTLLEENETLDIVWSFFIIFWTKSRPVVLHRFTKIEERLYSYSSKQRNGITPDGYWGKLWENHDKWMYILHIFTSYRNTKKLMSTNARIDKSSYNQIQKPKLKAIFITLATICLKDTKLRAKAKQYTTRTKAKQSPTKHVETPRLWFSCLSSIKEPNGLSKSWT